MTSKKQAAEQESGFKPEVKNIIALTLAFAKAVGKNQGDKGDNLLVSPYNAVACLAMVAKGADHETREEMAQALFGTDGASLDKAAAEYSALNDNVLKANKGQVELTTANGVWANKDLVKLRQSFVDDLQKTFDAEISAEDYADPATVKKINDWADKNTNGLIKEVLKELDPADAAVLASALYFKGQWTHKFDKSLTEDKTYTADGATASHTPMMHQDFTEGLSYLEGNDFEAISLTYGEEKLTQEEYKSPTMRLVLVRPTYKGVSARDWLAGQATGRVPAWLVPWAFEDAVGLVELPRLDIKQKHDLIPALTDMGITTVFNKDSADFTKMADVVDGRLFVSKVSHDVVFKTDEEGSEAAAVTAVMMTLGAGRPPVEIDVRFDRSFVVALQDIKTGAVLFIGAVNKPNNDMKPAAKTPKV